VRLTIDTSVFIGQPRKNDAVFAATALLFDSVIVSLDKDHASRCPKDLRAFTPGEALAELRLEPTHEVWEAPATGPH
jgi:hypothetical protein